MHPDDPKTIDPENLSDAELQAELRPHCVAGAVENMPRPVLVDAVKKLRAGEIITT